MASVYLCEDLLCTRRVAFSPLMPELAADRFEGAKASRTRSRSIVYERERWRSGGSCDARRAKRLASHVDSSLDRWLWDDPSIMRPVRWC